jgi:hypothetical protein
MDNAPWAWLLSGVRRDGARTRIRKVLALAAVMFAPIVSSPAHALETAPDERSRALQTFEQAEHDDEALDFSRAQGEYEQALRLDPSTSKAIRAEQRAKALRERAEGGFGPLVTLERVRRNPALSSDARAIDELVKASATFPPGIVRVEAWAFAAEAYARRLARPNEALELWRRVASDPATDPVLARATIKSLAMHHIARGELAEAQAAAALPLADQELVRDIKRVVRRHYMHSASIGTIALALLLAAAAIARAARAGRLREVLARARASSRLIVGYAAYVASGGALLASGYEDGTALPFLLLGATLVPLLLLARAWAAAGSSAPRARGLRAALCATSALAAAFLVLERTDVTYLEGLGL